MFFHIFLGSSNGFLDSQSVQVQIAVRSNSCFRRITYDTFLRVETFFRYITTFYQRNDRQVEVFCKRVVTTVVSRNGHDSTCTVTSQYIVADPYRNSLACKRIDSVRTTEHACYTTVGDTFTFGTFLGTIQISFHFCFLTFGCQQRNKLTFRSQHHECYSKHGIGTGRKDGKFQIAVFYLETNFRTFRTADPVTLCFLQ